MGLRLALDAILRLIASWRHELCNLVHTGFDYFRTGPVVDDLADFELVIAHLVAAIEGTCRFASARPSRQYRRINAPHKVAQRAVRRNPREP